MSFPIYHVVYLKQVNVIGVEQFKRASNLRFPGFFALSPDFGRQVEFIASTPLTQPQDCPAEPERSGGKSP
jgi:hypothetical protein